MYGTIGNVWDDLRDAKIAEAERLIKAKHDRQNIEQEARAIIYGDREKTYGHPAKNLEHIARLWSAHTKTTITAADVCKMMVMLKLARLTNNPGHRDSLIDAIGYIMLEERLHEND